MLIQWREEMAIDHGVIDQDHQTLIAIINAFGSTAPSAGALPELEAILDKLDRYAGAHFGREEGLQKLVKYPYREAHHRQHLHLIRTLTEIRQQLAALAAPPEAPAGNAASLHAKLAELLHHWLIDHVIKSDLRMKPYAAWMAPHARQLGPLAQSVK